MPKLPKPKQPGGEKHTTLAQRKDIILWLQEEDNFLLITGELATGKKMISGQPTTKETAYGILAEYINNLHGSKWTKDMAKGTYFILSLGRYETMMKKYKSAKEKSLSTGFGLSDSDVAKGIFTVEEKLEIMCPGYEELDKLFGESQKFNPTYVRQSTDPEENENEENEDPVDPFVDPSEVETDGAYTSLEDANNQRHLLNQIDAAITPANRGKKRPSSSETSSTESKAAKKEKEKDSSSKSFASMYAVSAADNLKISKERLEMDAEFKHKELELAKQRLNLEEVAAQKNYDLEEKRITDKKEERITQFVNTLIQQGKSSEEVVEYIKVLKDTL